MISGASNYNLICKIYHENEKIFLSNMTNNNAASIILDKNLANFFY